MKCQECGQVVTGGQRHDYVECIRYRWTSTRPRSGGPGGDAAELAQAEKDIASLLFVLDELRSQQPVVTYNAPAWSLGARG
jgi:hypothetical protein